MTLVILLAVLAQSELQVGYRPRFLDATTTGTLDTMFKTAPSAGPHVSPGISL